MQGRLLKKFRKQYQSHPATEWQKEFFIANKNNITYIEFIFDNFKPELNPLITKNGIKEIIKLKKKYKIKIDTICADYFMDNPLHLNNKLDTDLNFKVLEILIDNCKNYNCKNIILPCVDKSSLKKNNKSINNLLHIFEKIEKKLNRNKVNLLLECDLEPNALYKIIKRIDSKNFGINYDTGNSASLGYNIKEEFNAYGKYISEIHIKDRVLNGGPIILGKGNVNFNMLFDCIKKFNYNGLYIMQTYRDLLGKKIFFKQLKWFKSELKRYEKKL